MVQITPINSDNASIGLSVSWEKGQFVMIVTPKGLVSCGIVDKAVIEKFHFAVAIAHGTPELPLVTPEDLLKAKVTEVSEEAKKLGVLEGMTGREALKLLS